MNTPPPNSRDALVEQLSAYLDGELDPQESREVERLLARDEQARQELQRLERAWALLDQLPRVELTGEFIQSTVEMIALREVEELQSITQPSAVRPWLVRIGAAVAIIFVASFAYLAVQHWLDRHNRQLLVDLPVIERMDAYRQIDDVEFLRQLQAAGLFSTEGVKREP